MIENIFCPNCKKNVAEQLKNITEQIIIVCSPMSAFHNFKCNHCNAKLTACSKIQIKDIFGKPYLDTANIDISLDTL